MLKLLSIALARKKKIYNFTEEKKLSYELFELLLPWWISCIFNSLILFVFHISNSFCRSCRVGPADEHNPIILLKPWVHLSESSCSSSSLCPCPKRRFKMGKLKWICLPARSGDFLKPSCANVGEVRVFTKRKMKRRWIKGIITSRSWSVVKYVERAKVTNCVPPRSQTVWNSAMITAFQGRRCSSKRRTPTSCCCSPSVIGFVKAT